MFVLTDSNPLRFYFQEWWGKVIPPNVIWEHGILKGAKKLVEFSTSVLSRDGSCSEAMSELWTKHLTWKNWYSVFSSVLPTFDPTRLGSLTVNFWCQWDKMFGWISFVLQLRSWLWLKNLSGGFWQDTGEIVDHSIKSDL